MATDESQVEIFTGSTQEEVESAFVTWQSTLAQAVIRSEIIRNSPIEYILIATYQNPEIQVIRMSMEISTRIVNVTVA